MMMADLGQIQWDDNGQIEVLTFDIGGETLAIEAGVVREILDPLPETQVPGANPLVASVINFRGQVIPLANLHVAFGMQSDGHAADARVVVLELELDDEAMHLAIGTDRVNEVTPLLGVRWPRGLLRALVRRDGDVVLIPDFLAIFASLTDRSPEAASA